MGLIRIVANAPKVKAKKADGWFDPSPFPMLGSAP